jgi:UDP-glucose:glycoprotein glucosyltransferase
VHPELRLQMTPRGVQLWLARGRQRHLRDTLVMSNLGYFQLQASPGAWTLHLAPGASNGS